MECIDNLIKVYIDGKFACAISTHDNQETWEPKLMELDIIKDGLVGKQVLDKEFVNNYFWIHTK